MLIILLVIFVTSYFLFKHYEKVKSLPPGPFALPLVGNFPQMAFKLLRGSGTVEMLRDWSKEYGGVYTLWLGPMATVHIGQLDVAHEAMIKKGVNFVDRPYMYLMDIGRGGKGVISSSGHFWTEQRRFALHTLRNFGLGRNLMQDRIMMEFDYRNGKLLQQVEKNGGKITLNPAHLFELTVGNIINRLLFTERFTEEKEKEFFQLKKAMDKMTDDAIPLDFMLGKWNSQIWPFSKRSALFETPIENTLRFIKKQLNERKEEIASGKRDLSGGAEDFVDAFLMEMEKDEPSESFYEDSLCATLLDLWVAGQETTATTLYWAFAYLLSRPETLNLLQAEIDGVTGCNRPLELNDKSKTPYLNAVITETLRQSQIVPMNLMRETSENTQIGRYVIPKGTAISAEIAVIMSDSKIFDEPNKFKPERFVGTNLDSKVVSFGIGKRACLGESLARAELHLIIGNLVSSYNISPVPGAAYSTDAVTECGAMRKAKTYEMVIEKRV